MTKSIIIDSAYREETRVAVIENGILQDFDRETLSVKKVKGNIYLATITRIEPSLQAAFINYGDEKSGFLPFSDIHPRYYKLSDEEKAELLTPTVNNVISDYSVKDEGNEIENSDHIINSGSYSVDEETDISSLTKNIKLSKKYKIEEVIEVGQKILVQVLKEERGNKGVAMTSYISIAGKYCVLMTNIAGKGGISKKITNLRDRKSIRLILNDLVIDEDKSIIVRTAGIGISAEEIENDYKYLLKLWNHILTEAEKTKVPLLIHSEDDMIKKIIRDLNQFDIGEIAIEGNETYQDVSNILKLSRGDASNVKLHNERIPIFNKYKIEDQINQLYERHASLPSGGSIVIDQTEALIAIDVNSGKATNHKDIEETAYKTNLEAVQEIARQIRLRDLSGLLIIDFIDMDDQKNRRLIEKSLRDALKNDRARIQIGKISIFGLLELSRQRTSNSFFETITKSCSKCNGSGFVKSEEVLSLNILRSIRYAVNNDNQTGVIYVKASSNVIAYMMNYKRFEINKIEKSCNIYIIMHNDESISENNFQIRKRKNLLEDERKLLLLDSEKIGKVNQMGFAKKSYGYSDNRKSYKNNRKHTKKEVHKSKESKSFLSKLFGK